RRAEQAHRESEVRRRLIIDTAYDAFVAMDAEGRITDWNRQAETTFGWSREQALGQPLADLIVPPRLREAHWRGLRHFLGAGHGGVLNKGIELPALVRDGRECPVELTISPIRSEGSQFFSAFVHDISERKRAETALAEERNLLRSLIDNLPDYI